MAWDKAVKCLLQSSLNLQGGQGRVILVVDMSMAKWFQGNVVRALRSSSAAEYDTLRFYLYVYISDLGL